MKYPERVNYFVFIALLSYYSIVALKILRPSSSFFFWIYKLVLGSNHDFKLVVWIIVTTVVYCYIYPTAPEVIQVHMQVKWSVEQIVEREKKKVKMYYSTSHFNLNKSLMRRISH